MNILDAQKDMRYGYLGGGVGMFVSGIVWLISGVIALNGEQSQAIWTLLIGGALISPVSGIITKILGRPDKATQGNPLVSLAMEGTVWLIFGSLIAYGVSQLNPQWFYPAMLLTIGGRYLTFSTLYGIRAYWLCGALLAMTGFVLVVFNVPFTFQAFSGALIEILFAPFIFLIGKKEIEL